MSIVHYVFCFQSVILSAVQMTYLLHYHSILGQLGVDFWGNILHMTLPHTDRQQLLPLLI